MTYEAENPVKRKRVKIIVSSGPTLYRGGAKLMEELIKNGADVLRINAGFDDPKIWTDTAQAWWSVNEFKPVAIDIRASAITVRFPERNVRLRISDRLKIGKHISFQPDISGHLEEGMILLMRDGSIVLEYIGNNELLVLSGGEVRSCVNVVIPDLSYDVELPTERDVVALKWAIEHASYVYVSFTHTPEDIRAIRDFMEDNGKKVFIYAKIESKDGVKNINKIAKEADGLIVARGDLGIVYPLEMVPVLQREILRIGLKEGKPVVVATQLLSSMVDSPRPTRAKVNDVATAVMEGASALFLSEETSIGKYPVEAVGYASRIATLVQDYYKKEGFLEEILRLYDGERFVVFPKNAEDLKTIASFQPCCEVKVVSDDIPLLRLAEGIYGVRTSAHFTPEPGDVVLRIDGKDIGFETVGGALNLYPPRS